VAARLFFAPCGTPLAPTRSEERHHGQHVLGQKGYAQVRTYVRKVEEALAAGDKAAAVEAFKVAEPELMRAATKGVVHKNTASRKVSRLAQRVKTLSA